MIKNKIILGKVKTKLAESAFDKIFDCFEELRTIGKNLDFDAEKIISPIVKQIEVIKENNVRFLVKRHTKESQAVSEHSVKHVFDKIDMKRRQRAFKQQYYQWLKKFISILKETKKDIPEINVQEIIRPLTNVSWEDIKN